MPNLTSSIIVSDLHLNTNPRDAARWKIWDCLHKTVREFDIQYLFILGDLTEEKDFHSAHLVNGLVEDLDRFKIPVHILRGNHDGIDPAEPYFRFLNRLPGVTFYVTPALAVEHPTRILMLPHFEKTIPDLFHFNPELVMAHFTVDGSRDNRVLSGVPLAEVEAVFGSNCPVYSGHVHVPQKVGPVQYVGAPYHIKFGDDFVPGFWVFNRSGEQIHVNTSAEFPARHYLTVKSLADFRLIRERCCEGDQIKVKIELEHFASNWQDYETGIKETVANMGAELIGTEFSVIVSADHSSQTVPVASLPRRAQDALLAYCERMGLDPAVTSLGRRLLSEAEQ